MRSQQHDRARRAPTDGLPLFGGPPAFGGELQSPQPCESCGAPMLWVITHKGNRMPLDPEPVAGFETDRQGYLFDPETRHRLWVFADDAMVRLARTGDQAERLFLSHFATCPDADDWRGHPRR